MPQVTIAADYSFGKILERLPDEVNVYIDTRTKYHPAGYDKTWNYKKKRWDGFNHTYNQRDQTFRVGLLTRVQHALKYHGYTTTVLNGTPELFVKSDDIRLGEGIIRPYEFQAKCRSVAREHSMGIIESPTGTGKSVMMGLIVDELRVRTLLIFNDLVLCDQMQRNLQRYFPGHGIGYIGNLEFELGDIVVATVQSLSSILGLQDKKQSDKSIAKAGELREWMKGVGLVLHDEVHLADSDTSIALYDLFGSIPKRFGFSATPYEWSDKSTKVANIELEQVFGRTIYSTFATDFVALGLRVPCIVRNIEVPHRVKVYGTFRDNQGVLYKKALDYEILKDPVWHNHVKQVVDEYANSGASVFVYASHSLEYGQKIADLLDTEFVQGKTPRKERFRLFDALHEKKIKCLVSDIGGIGLDIPSLDAFVLASDSKDIRQMAGRVVRAWPQKEYGHFVDLYKTCSFLEGHHNKRLNQYESVLGAIQLST